MEFQKPETTLDLPLVSQNDTKTNLETATHLLIFRYLFLRKLKFNGELNGWRTIHSLIKDVD